MSVIIKGMDAPNMCAEIHGGERMTFRERLKLEHPEYVNEKYFGGCKGCPGGYGYEENSPSCSFVCAECWNREIPESEALSSSETPKVGEIWEDIKSDAQKVIVKVTNGAVVYYAKTGYLCSDYKADFITRSRNTGKTSEHLTAFLEELEGLK